jgi:ADP-heptose:LPS heptosyltransferase
MAKRYLIVKIVAIGDVIMALPMVEEIRKLDKNADITWICGKSVVPILEKFSIDHIIAIDDQKLLTGSKLQKISVVFDVWRKIAGRQYDVVALGHAARRYQILTLLTRKKIYRSFSHIMGRMWPIPGRHHTDEYVRLINPENKKPVKSALFPQVKLSMTLQENLRTDKSIL